MSAILRTKLFTPFFLARRVTQSALPDKAGLGPPCRAGTVHRGPSERRSTPRMPTWQGHASGGLRVTRHHPEKPSKSQPVQSILARPSGHRPPSPSVRTQLSRHHPENARDGAGSPFGQSVPKPTGDIHISVIHQSPRFCAGPMPRMRGSGVRQPRRSWGRSDNQRPRLTGWQTNRLRLAIGCREQYHENGADDPSLGRVWTYAALAGAFSSLSRPSPPRRLASGGRVMNVV